MSAGFLGKEQEGRPPLYTRSMEEELDPDEERKLVEKEMQEVCMLYTHHSLLLNVFCPSSLHTGDLYACASVLFAARRVVTKLQELQHKNEIDR